MAKTVMVTVENIKNPTVKRQMTVNSAKMNSKKWRVVEGEDQQLTEQVKKKDVSPAVAKKGNPEVVVTLPTAEKTSEFATIGDAEVNEKTALQKEYEELSGSKPDGRWNEGKLKEKIATLKTPA
jgi:hypothetical protein